MFFALPRKEIKNPQLVAHRGGCLESGKEFENRIEAYKKATAADVWETDLHLTKDGVIVLIHDGELKERPISDYSRRELEGQIDTLNELLKIKPPHVGLLLDIKGSDPAIIFALEKVKENISQENIVLICFNLKLIERIYEGKQAGKLRNEVFLLTNSSKNYSDKGELNLVTVADCDAALKIINDFSLSGIGLEYAKNDEAMREIVLNLRQSKPEIKIQLWCYQENECEQLFDLAIKLGVDYCNTDKPSWARRYLEKDDSEKELGGRVVLR